MTRRCWPVFYRCSLRCLLCVVCVIGGPAGSVVAATIEVYYAPEDEPLARLSKIYDHASRYIYVAVYALTSPLAVKGLVDAKKRGLDVRVITDRERLNDQKQRTAVETLHLAGIPVLVNQHDGLMHLKQVVIDDEINASGSMNHTGSGNRYNDERLDVIHDHAITTKAREKFLAMWEDEQRFHRWTP
ncbi:MAG: PLD phosphodiesterase domain-containing protein [Nitrospira sp.]|nr:MAG: PLD phosphodiesterase domain-containing protein [Nitrospira sp.]